MLQKIVIIMVQNLSIQMQVVKLQAGIKYAEEDLPNAKVHVHVHACVCTVYYMYIHTHVAVCQDYSVACYS